MKKDNKSVLSIKIMLIILATLSLILVIFLKMSNVQLAYIDTDDIIYINEIDNSNENLTEIKVADVDRADEAVTSRYAVDRNVVSNTEQENTISDNNIVSESSEEVITSNAIQYKSIDEITISRDMDLTQSCGISKSDFKELLKNTSEDTTDFFYDNSDLIYDLCQEYQLNEIFFCGLIAGESGWNIASGHRSTYNYISLMSNGHLIKYSSVEEGLETAAKKLHNNYLTPGGCYYSGKTLSAVQKIFCPNSSTWVSLIYTCMSQIV